MMRAVVFPSIFLALVACSTSPNLSPGALMERAQADTKLRRDIDAMTTFAVAKYAGLTEQPQQSAENYTRLLASVQDDPWVAEQAIYSVLRIGEVNQAVQLAKRLPPETLNATELPRLTLAADALRRGDRDKALSYLNQPWSNTYHAMLARSIAAWSAIDDDPAGAITLQLQAGGSEGIFALMSQTLGAVMQAGLGDTDVARQSLEQLWSIRARLALGVETEARILALSGETDAALNRLDDFRTEVGRHPALVALEAEIERGEVSAIPRHTAAQGAALAIYIATAPQASQNYGDVPAAYFALAVHLDPDLDAAKALWADTLDQSDRRPEAIRLLASIPPSSIHHTSAQGQLAWALRREGRDDEALETARETLKRTDDRNIRVQLADLLQSLGRDGEAEATFTDIIDADAAQGDYDWRIYYARGAARERLGEWPRAENDLRTAMTLNPDDPTIMNYLGYSWIDRGLNLNEGLALIEKALRLDPENGAITDSLGWAHYKMGNYERAVFYLERATELAPDIAEILDHLGDAYWQVGRFKEAGFQWQRALTYAESEDEKALLQKKLDGGIALLQAATEPRSTSYP